MLRYSDIMAINAEVQHFCTTPRRYNRNWSEDVSIECAERLKKMTTARTPKTGRGVVFLHNDNLGTKRFPDFRRIIHVTTIEKITDKCIFTSDGCRIRKEDIVCVYIERG